MDSVHLSSNFERTNSSRLLTSMNTTVKILALDKTTEILEFLTHCKSRSITSLRNPGSPKRIIIQNLKFTFFNSNRKENI